MAPSKITISHRNHHYSPVIFSFGQQKNPNILIIQDYPAKLGRCENKFQFIIRMIQKYEPKASETSLNLQNNYTKVQQQLQLYQTKGYQKSPLSTSRHQDQDFKTKDNTKETANQLEKELEKSHRQILGKYTTPLRNQHQDLQKDESLCQSISYEGTIFDYLNSSQSSDHIEQNQLEQQESISPIRLVESVMMYDPKDGSMPRQKSQKSQKQTREISDFIIPEQQETKDQLKLRHLFVFCGLTLIIIFWLI